MKYLRSKEVYQRLGRPFEASTNDRLKRETPVRTDATIPKRQLKK